jgi:hypothetical protein
MVSVIAGRQMLCGAQCILSLQMLLQAMGPQKDCAESHLSITNAYILSAIDRMTFDKSDTEILVKISSSN